MAEATRLETLAERQRGALRTAQLGGMMGKGLVIAALLQRSYGDNWLDELKGMPAALNPTAMARLGKFALDCQLSPTLSWGFAATLS